MVDGGRWLVSGEETHAAFFSGLSEGETSPQLNFQKIHRLLRLRLSLSPCFVQQWDQWEDEDLLPPKMRPVEAGLPKGPNPSATLLGPRPCLGGPRGPFPGLARSLPPEICQRCREAADSWELHWEEQCLRCYAKAILHHTPSISISLQEP